MDTILALSTFALAVFTGLMAWSTYKLARESREASFRQIGIQTWLEFSKRFDSQEMLKARATLALSIGFGVKPKSQKDVAETVMNFFEDLGIVYQRGYIDKHLAKDTFGFYVCRWWEIAKTYIDYERKTHNDDKTLFEEFEKLAIEMRLTDEVIDIDELKLFIADEKILTKI